MSTRGLPPSPIPHASQATTLKLVPGATGELPLPSPGVYELDVTLMQGNERKAISGFAPRVLSIEPGAPPPELKLTIPASAIPADAR